MTWLIAMLVLAAALIAFLGWACVKVGADADRRAVEHDEHEEGLPL